MAFAWLFVWWILFLSFSLNVRVLFYLLFLLVFFFLFFLTSTSSTLDKNKFPCLFVYYEKKTRRNLWKPLECIAAIHKYVKLSIVLMWMPPWIRWMRWITRSNDYRCLSVCTQHSTQKTCIWLFILIFLVFLRLFLVRVIWFRSLLVLLMLLSLPLLSLLLLMLMLLLLGCQILCSNIQ